MDSMNRKEKSTNDSATEPSSKTLKQPLYTRMIRNSLLVWLDANLDEVKNEHYYNTITQWRQLVNVIHTFTDVNECVDFIRNVQDEKIFMVVSEALVQKIAPIVQDIVRVICVYVFTKDAVQHMQWSQQYSKVKDVFTNITQIIGRLQRDAYICDENSVPISFIKPDDGFSQKDLDKLDQSFMYTKILKETLLTIDFKPEHITEFLTYYREQLADNTIELKNVDKFQNEYHHDKSIWWYTSQGFLYSTLNKALRTMEIDSIMKMGFFLRDIDQNIITLHVQQFNGPNQSNPFIVYRGQGLTLADFDQLMKTQGGLLSFNSFMSTSLDLEVAHIFAESSQFDPDLIGVLFKITINPSISSTSFANVSSISAHDQEEEILFSMDSVFRIGKMGSVYENDRLWHCELTLTDDNDPQLHALTHCIRDEISTEYSGWHRLGKLLLRLNKSNQAEQLYQKLLIQTTDEEEIANLTHQLGQTKHLQGEYQETITL